MIKKFESFDTVKDDFDMGKREVLIALKNLMKVYDDFTKDVSPKNWRTTGTHWRFLQEMKEEVKNFIPVTPEERKNEFVEDARSNKK